MMYWNTGFFSDVLDKIHNSYPTARQHRSNQSWGAVELVPHLSTSKALRSRQCEQLCVCRRLRGNSTHYFAAVAVILILLAVGSNEEVERCATITNQQRGSLNEQASLHRPRGVLGFLMTFPDSYKCAAGSKNSNALKLSPQSELWVQCGIPISAGLKHSTLKSCGRFMRFRTFIKLTRLRSS